MTDKATIKMIRHINILILFSFIVIFYACGGKKQAILPVTEPVMTDTVETKPESAIEALDTEQDLTRLTMQELYILRSSVYARHGVLFDEHELERQYQDIDIADDAFESLFEFFDKWRWHLDTRITANGKDINPDVLGYIFEQYINDRAQMGAYYTKEDI